MTTSADGPPSEPVGWRSALAMLQLRMSRREIARALADTLGLEDGDIDRAIDFASEWHDGPGSR